MSVCMCVCVCVSMFVFVFVFVYAFLYVRERQTDREPPKNGEIALWPNTRVVKCKYCVSQKRNEANDKDQWYSVLLTYIS